jgi:hypothetical protein
MLSLVVRDDYSGDGTVPLIFLDTPQIALLEETLRIDPVRYSSFCGAWKQREYTLVFTGAQAGELARYEDASRREARYQVLADLAPIRTDFFITGTGRTGPQTLMEREIVRAAVERGLITATGTGIDQLVQWTEVLPGSLNASEAGLLRDVMESEDYRNLENQVYKAARFAAGAEKAAGQAKKRGLVRDLPAAPIPPEKVIDCWAGFGQAVALLKEQSRLQKLPPISEHSQRAFRDIFREFLGRSQEIGNRATLLEYLPVAGPTKSEQLKLDTHELANRFVFENVVRFVARTAFNASDTEQEFLARTLDFADCPGSWLERRLRLCVERGSSEPKPSHHNDAARLAYLPYVHVLFTDAEMAEFVRQVRSDESSPKRIRDLQPPLTTSASLDALEEALDLPSSRTGEAAVTRCKVISTDKQP